MISTLGLIPDSVEELTRIVGMLETLEDCNQITLGMDNMYLKLEKQSSRKYREKRVGFMVNVTNKGTSVRLIARK